MEQSDIDRFFTHVNKTDTCLLWTVYICIKYGHFRCQGNKWRSHRLALVLAGETLIKGLDVCHSCRNKHCVNPAHLRQDTRKANQHDRIADGTDTRGEKSVHSKLTNEKVLAIRASNKSQNELAKEYNVSYQLISSVISRQRWSHI